MLKLLQGMSGKDRSVWLFSSAYSTDWHCHFESKGKELSLKIEVEGDSPEKAIEKCWLAYHRAVGALPEIAPTLPRPLGPDFQEEFVADLPAYAGQHDSPPIDDEVPF